MVIENESEEGSCVVRSEICVESADSENALWSSIL